MARKNKPRPLITHTEILCYAHRHLEAHVAHWEKALEGQTDATQALQSICGRELEQLTALEQLYKLETGEDW